MYEPYPFKIEFNKDPGTYDSLLDELDPLLYGFSYKDVIKNTTVRVTAIVYYKDNISKVYTINTVISINSKGQLNGSLIDDAFRYKMQFGSPDYIELIISPHECYPCKWMINVSTDNQGVR